MRIEIDVGGAESPVSFTLESPKTMIGSDPGCDIHVTSPGISRRHLSFMVEGDRVFVVDQGSTNGSYINDERLVPGRKVELTSFYHLRLGVDVLVTLLTGDGDFHRPPPSRGSRPGPCPSPMTPPRSGPCRTLRRLRPRPW